MQSQVSAASEPEMLRETSERNTGRLRKRPLPLACSVALGLSFPLRKERGAGWLVETFQKGVTPCAAVDHAAVPTGCCWDSQREVMR